MSKFQIFLSGLSGWFHIFLFPVLISFIMSLLVYLTMPAAIGVALSALLVFIGMIVGVIMATRILRKRGAASFVVQPDTTEAPEPNTNENTLSQD